MADDEKELDINTVKVLNAIRGLLLVVVPCLVGVIAVYSTVSSITSSIHKNAHDIRSAGILNDERHERAQQTIEQLRGRLDNHVRLGPNELGHPQGVMSDLLALRNELRLLEKKLEVLEKANGN